MSNTRRGRGKAAPKPKPLNQQAIDALRNLQIEGVTTTELLRFVVSAIKQLHDGYNKEVVTPKGDIVTVTEYDLKAAATLSTQLIKTLNEIEVLASTATEDESTEVRFVSKPVIIPVDTRLAREAREALELNQDVNNGVEDEI